MQNDSKFWLYTMARGVMAIILGSGILVWPDLARTVLLLPISYTMSLIMFAAYGIMDGALNLISSLWAGTATLRWIGRVQGLAGVVLGLLLLTLLFDHARLPWFLSLITVQAIFTAVTEMIAGRNASTRNLRLWDYSGALVASGFGLFYLYARSYLADRLTYKDLFLLIYGFLLAFGIAECINSGLMLYRCREADHAMRTA